MQLVKKKVVKWPNLKKKIKQYFVLYLKVLIYIRTFFIRIKPINWSSKFVLNAFIQHLLFIIKSFLSYNQENIIIIKNKFRVLKAVLLFEEFSWNIRYKKSG